ncbi:arginine--tRNA ligase, partial [bacterium]|nr:arginine--tRNA ligase [bacterium]
LTSLKKHIGKGFTVSADMLAEPPKPEYGDLSFPCFQLAKGMGRNPVEIATELAAKMGPSELIARIHAVGPYVNFVFNADAFGAATVRDVLSQKSRYGKGGTGKGRKVMVEYANLNTHKEVHVGHLRNLALGQATVEIMRANGYEVIPVAYINDLGNNVARCLWGMTTLYPDVQPEGDYLNFLGRVYTEATAALEADESKRAEVSEIQRQLENMEGAHVPLWKKTQKWSMDNLREVYAEFGLELAHTYVEHELIDETHNIVKKLLTSGIAKMSEGAAIVDLEKEGLGVNLLRKTDGTLLYNAKDLALAYKKEENYHADRLIIVVDVRQSLAFKQLIATLKRMDFSREIVHLPYEFVTLPEGAMSSRKGNIVRWSDIRDAMLEKLEEAIRSRHADWKEKQVQKTARALLFASIKFGMLKQDPDKVITFSMDDAMATEGFTGPYVMYTIARISSILRKAFVKPAKTITHLKHPLERELVGKIAKYPEVVLQAGLHLKPSVIAQYAFELAQTYARYYESVRVLADDDHEGTAERLALCGAIRQTLTNALGLLGIAAIEEM